MVCVYDIQDSFVKLA